MVTISSINENDLSKLSLLYQELFAKEQKLTRMKEAFKEIENNSNYLLLAAKDNGRLVGSAMGVICTDLFGECRPFMVIENVIISSESRYKGIGKKLIRELEIQAIKRDCYYAILVSSADRKDAHRFYISLGYDRDAYRGFKKHFISQPGA